MPRINANVESVIAQGLSEKLALLDSAIFGFGEWFGSKAWVSWIAMALGM